jgi:hypothetical protein
MSDADLANELAKQASELGVKIDLSYKFGEHAQLIFNPLVKLRIAKYCSRNGLSSAGLATA